MLGWLTGYWGDGSLSFKLLGLVGLGLVAMYALNLIQFLLALVTLQAISRVASSLRTRIFHLSIMLLLDT